MDIELSTPVVPYSLDHELNFRLEGIVLYHRPRPLPRHSLKSISRSETIIKMNGELTVQCVKFS